jgi:hypothetical protein
VDGAPLLNITSMQLHLRIVSLVAAGFYSFFPLSLAHGHSAGEMSSVVGHGNEQGYEPYRYSDPYRGLYTGYAGNADSDYSYTPTPEQQATAAQQVEDYLAAVKKGRRHAATHRYISVETLRPTKKQREDYTKKQPPVRRVEPAQLRCLMVFDTQTRQFVGSGCYVLSSEPSVGEISKFETVSAEFVGQGTL